MSETKSKRIEKRISPRAKVSRMLRVRPSDPDVEHFEELPVTVNVSKRGIYFHTHRTDYHVGMRLFVTYPFTFENDPMKSEYVGEVVRVDKLDDNRAGIAVHLIMTV
jgi:PilZ domain